MALKAVLAAQVTRMRAYLDAEGMLQDVLVTNPGANGEYGTGVTHKAFVEYQSMRNREEWEVSYTPESRTAEQMVKVLFFGHVPVGPGTKLRVSGRNLAVVSFSGPANDTEQIVTEAVAVV